MGKRKPQGGEHPGACWGFESLRLGGSFLKRHFGNSTVTLLAHWGCVLRQGPLGSTFGTGFVKAGRVRDHGFDDTIETFRRGFTIRQFEVLD